MNHPVVESIGIEFETDNIVRGGNNSNVFMEEHDASIESYKYTDPVSPGTLFDVPITRKSKRLVAGTEFKSRVLSFNSKSDIYPMLETFLADLESRGESEESIRCGIHVHVCMPFNLSILKNALRIGAHLEQVFFYLGGLGYTNRGVYNDFAFFRPITMWGPVVAPTKKGLGQCFNLNDLCSATSTKDFFYRYGGISTENVPTKYTPVRYHWLTLYPLLTYSTIEYRVFNKTLNPIYLYTIVKFCQQVSKNMLYNDDTLKENSIYTPQSKEYIVDTLMSFIDKYGLKLTEQEIKTLISIIERTPTIKMKETYMLSHLMAGGRLSNIFDSSYCTPVISPANCIEPEVRTIHNDRNGAMMEPLLG